MHVIMRVQNLSSKILKMGVNIIDKSYYEFWYVKIIILHTLCKIIITRDNYVMYLIIFVCVV